MKDFYKQVLRIVTDRIFIVFIFIMMLFVGISIRLYDLQIIHHSEYDSNVRATIQRQIEVDAPRGLIFDRYGRPLAVNKPTYVINIDQGVTMAQKERDEMLLRLISLLKSNGDQYVDEIPITQIQPFEYRFSESARKQFLQMIPFKNNEEKEKTFHYTAQELFEYLRGPDVFDIDESISDSDARELMALRYELYKYSWSKYKLITVATDVGMDTISTVEEKHTEFSGVIVDVKPVRYYPEGELFSHIIGYTRKITTSQFEAMEKEGYEKDDVVGQMGIEQALESELRGIKGKETVEVDNRGRKVRTVNRENEVQGNNIFLTIDAQLQRKTYDIIENQLTQAIIERLKGGSRDIKAITGKEMLYSIIESNGISFDRMKEAETDSKQYEVSKRLEQEFKEMNEYQRENITYKQLLLQWMDEDDQSLITEKEIMLILNEQQLLNLDETTVNNFKNNKYGSIEGTLIEQMEKGILKPKHMSIDPFSAAAAVVDVHTGEILTIVGYPSYDANQMITNFNEYYPLLADESDQRRLLIDRSVRTAKAPGSTFKMITGIAALEEKVVTPQTLIYDSGIYTKAGTPYARCWTYHNGGRGHGNTDIRRAIEASCNFYFYESAFRLGEGSSYPYQNISTLNKYVEKFGLNQKSGIEISESEPSISSPDAVVKKELSIVLSNIKNMDEERGKTYIDLVIQRIVKGYIPWADPYDQSLEGKIERELQYELKRNAEPAISNVLEPKLEMMLNSTVDTFQKFIEEKDEQIIRNVITGVMSDSYPRLSLRSKTRIYLIEEIEDTLRKNIEPTVEEALNLIVSSELKEAYEHAYTVAYRRLLRSSSDEELISTLKYRMENIDSEMGKFKQDLASRVTNRIIDNIVEQTIERADLVWSDGETIRTAIGQGKSAFTPVQVANYTTAIANREHVYDLRLVDAIQNTKEDDAIIEKETIVRNKLNISKSTMDIIHEGMLLVTTGTEGTARNIYSDFEIPVGGKTGTAQDGGHEHAWFVGFAPYDQPEVAIVTTIYNADGAGRYNSIISRQILEAYFGLKQEYEQTTLDNIFKN